MNSGLCGVTNKTEIEEFLRQSLALHVYGIGDLDDFFWPFTTWYGWYEGGALASLFLLYTGTDLPVVLALEESRPDAAERLLQAVLPSLPKRCYSHVSPHLVPVLRAHASLEPRGLHHKMRLRDSSALAKSVLPQFPTRHLGQADLPIINELYRNAYPDTWFDQRMLETGKYAGVFHDDRLIAIAGIHVYSRKYRVCALGNITTLPAFRGRGVGAHATAWLCEDLLKDVDFIGLNVKADNRAAIRCYEKIGFEFAAPYEEFMIEVSCGVRPSGPSP